MDYWIEYSDIFKKCITIDWLEIFGTMEDKRLQFNANKERTSFALTQNGNYHVEFAGYGTSTFERMYKTYFKTKLIGALYTIPRIKNTSFTPESVCFKISNDILYRNDWYEILIDFIETCEFKFSNITRLDIALDGANHMLKFFTAFTASKILERDNHYITKTGQSELFPKALNMTDCYFDGFQIGSRKSDKHLIIYNKSKEIKVSGKKYINDYWTANGITANFHDYMIRTEISLRSKKLTNYTNKKLSLLTDSKHLVSLFQKETANFLDFRYKTDSVITRCPAHAIIDYRQIKFDKLEKTQIKEVDDMYKIKMSIHSDFLLMCKGLANGTENKIIEAIDNKIMLYGLEDWYFKKREEWKQTYKCFQNTGHIYEITSLND